jgi:hypothetical protein
MYLFQLTAFSFVPQDLLEKCIEGNGMEQ